MRFRRLTRKLALAALTLVVVFLVTEVVTRLREPGPFAWIDTNPFVFAPDYQHTVHETDFEGAWEGTWYSLNARGMRGPEVAGAKAQDELRVVCLGDSCTFGKGVRESETWPRQLETLLRAELPARRSATVYNLGVNSFAGFQYAHDLEQRGLELQPDLVVVGYNLNDFPNVIRAVDEAIYGDRSLRRFLPQPLMDRMGRTGTYRFAREMYYHWQRGRDWANAENFAQGTAESRQDAEVWAREKGYLERIAELARGAGAEVVVFLFPYESQVYADFYDQTPIELMREMCADIGLPFVDLADEFRAEAERQDPPRRLFLRGDRYHPTAEGYGIVAACVLRVMRERGWPALVDGDSESVAPESVPGDDDTR